MKRISNDQTALVRVVSCVYRVSQRVTGAAGRGGWVTVVICNRSTPCISLRPFITMVSVCVRENDARPFPIRFPAQCRQLSSTIFPCQQLRYDFGHKLCKYTAAPFFVKCKRCNTVTLWLPCFRLFCVARSRYSEMRWWDYLFIPLLRRRQVPNRPFHVMNYSTRTTYRNFNPTSSRLACSHRYEMIRSPLPA